MNNKVSEPSRKWPEASHRKNTVDTLKDKKKQTYSPQAPCTTTSPTVQPPSQLPVGTQTVLNCMQQSQQWRTSSSWKNGICERLLIWSKLRKRQEHLHAKRQYSQHLSSFEWQYVSIPQFVTAYIRLNFGKKNTTIHSNIPFFQHSKWQRHSQCTEWVCKMLTTHLNQNWLVIMEVAIITTHQAFLAL